MTRAAKVEFKHAVTSMHDSRKAQQVAWVLLVVLLFAVPLVCGWPSGPWIPSGFGAVGYALAISVCLLCGPKRTRRTHVPWLALGVLAALVCGLILVEAYTIRMLNRWGLVGLSRMGLIGDRIPAAPTLKILEFILSTIALVLWTALQPKRSADTPPNRARSKANQCEVSGHRFVCSLALGTLIAFGLRAAASTASSGGWHWPFVCLLFSAGLFPILAALSQSRGNVFVICRGKRYGLGEGSRLCLASVLFGMLLWSLFDVIGWLFLTDASVRSMGTAAVLLFLACGGIVLAILASRDDSRFESASQASRSDNFSEEGGRSVAFAPSPLLLEEIPGIEALSEKELLVVTGTLSGLSQSKMASRMSVGSSTVGSYRSRAYRKLGVTSKQELIGLIEGTAAKEKPGRRGLSGRCVDETLLPTRKGRDVGFAAMEVAAKLMWLWALVACIPTTMDSAGLLAGFGLGCLLQALLRSACASAEGTTSLLGLRASRTTRLVLMTMTSLLAACLSFISERAIYGGVWLIPVYGSLLLGVIEGALLSVLISWAIVDLPGAGVDFPTLRHIFRAELPKMAPVGTLGVLNLLVAILAGRSILAMVTALEVIALSALLGKVDNGECGASPTDSRLEDLYPSSPGFQVALFALATLCIVGTRLNLVGGWPAQGFLSACALGIVFQILRLEGSRRGLRLALFGFALGALSFIGTPRPGKGLGYLGVLALLLLLVAVGTCLYRLRIRVLERTNNLFNVEETVLRRYLKDKGFGEIHAEVVRLTLLGFSASTISARLNVTPGTVASYRARAYKRLGVHSRSGLVRQVERGIFGPLGRGND